MAKRYRAGVWYQVGGNGNPATYGGTIARDDGGWIEVREIQPMREYVGDREAAEVGYPYWSKEACYSLADLHTFLADRSYRSIVGLDTMDDPDRIFNSDNNRWSRARRMAVAAVATLSGYLTDEGPAGWSSDVLPGGRVSWWHATCREFREEDREFRRLLKEIGD